MPPLPGSGNPFGDDHSLHSSHLAVNLHSPLDVGSPSEAALPTGTSRDGGFANVYDHIGNRYDGRPLSDATQAGSLISPGDVNIASATGGNSKKLKQFKMGLKCFVRLYSVY